MGKWFVVVSFWTHELPTVSPELTGFNEEIRPHPVLVARKDSPLGQIGSSMKTLLFFYKIRHKQNKIVAKILEQISSQFTLTITTL